MIQTYDVIMLVVLAGSTLFGVWKGMAWQVASLASVVVSGAVAVHSSAAVAPYFPGQAP
jgi:membrane protein required for colicin V production